MLFCAIHIARTAFGVGLVDLASVFAGAIALAFALRNVGADVLFRKVGREILEPRLEIIVGGVPPRATSDSTQWTRDVLNACCTADPSASAKERALKLMRLFLGIGKKRELGCMCPAA